MKRARSCMKSLLVAVVVALGVPLSVGAGSLEPSATPAPTMRTLEEQTPAWNKIITGSKRFVDALDGSAALDKETGLVWMKNANYLGTVDTNNALIGLGLVSEDGKATYHAAHVYCSRLVYAGRMGWRLPSYEELTSLVDWQEHGILVLPTINPFSNYGGTFWTSSTFKTNETVIQTVQFFPTAENPIVGLLWWEQQDSQRNQVWCVRGGR